MLYNLKNKNEWEGVRADLNLKIQFKINGRGGGREEVRVGEGVRLG